MGAVGDLGEILERADAPGCGLGVEHDSRRREDHPAAALGHSPTEVEVIAKQRELAVEPPEELPGPTSYEHAGAAHGEDVTLPVVLALVVLTDLDPRLAMTGSGDGDSDLEQALGTRPRSDPATDHADGRVRSTDREQLLEGLCGRSAVVMKQPEPPIGVGYRGGEVGRHLNRFAEPEAPVDGVDHGGPERLVEIAGRAVR